MFPWVCLAELPLFCKPDWPRRIFQIFNYEKCTKTGNDVKHANIEKRSSLDINKMNKSVSWRQRLVCILLLSHCGIQAFLPYSHFITKVSQYIAFISKTLI